MKTLNFYLQIGLMLITVFSFMIGVWPIMVAILGLYQLTVSVVDILLNWSKSKLWLHLTCSIVYLAIVIVQPSLGFTDLDLFIYGVPTFLAFYHWYISFVTYYPFEPITHKPEQV
jgi:hypothetical protein